MPASSSSSNTAVEGIAGTEVVGKCSEVRLPIVVPADDADKILFISLCFTADVKYRVSIAKFCIKTQSIPLLCSPLFLFEIANGHNVGYLVHQPSFALVLV